MKRQDPPPTTPEVTPQRRATGLLPCTVRLIHAMTGNRFLLFLLAVLLVVGIGGTVAAQNARPVMAASGTPNLSIPKITLGMEQAKNGKDMAGTLQVLLMMTVLTIAPSILIMTTAFTRLVIVLSIMRSAIGLPQVPPNQVLIGLALFMTFFIMRPTFADINDHALQPYFTNKITFTDALDKGVKPLRSFMIRQTYTKDYEFFIRLAKLPTAPANPDDVPLSVVIPSFITSELKTAFIIGFYIYLPFLVIDIVVASTLMSMGMMMLPPTVVSIPAKLLLFVMANGWTLLLGSLVKGFR